MIFKLKATATLLVVMRTPLLLEQIKLTEILDFTSFKSLLMLKMWVLALIIILLMLFNPIETMICFLERLLVVILNLGLLFWFDVLIIL